MPSGKATKQKMTESLRRVVQGQAEILQRQATTQAMLQLELRNVKAMLQEALQAQDQTQVVDAAPRVADLEAELAHARQKIHTLESERMVLQERALSGARAAERAKAERVAALQALQLANDQSNASARAVLDLREELEALRLENHSLRRELALGTEELRPADPGSATNLSSIDNDDDDDDDDERERDHGRSSRAGGPPDAPRKVPAQEPSQAPAASARSRAHAAERICAVATAAAAPRAPPGPGRRSLTQAR
ncbi:Hypothetical Protein FCC1311_070062 [Hondaea fermentalgiana]|uniref:Uncharacterized protein n=1 Tax=Hondaea fermentalgiana TaxID=2315210 RepID=A0A2R5GIS1_9STRA|nr:Hypothetical Protein FCC1311_070062 [Hondaea fermentalgiana]|eukprot:GBG30786.1 Hypothetical Protein FCC1311_070062 [Hondaea fermentalgiana]